MTHGLAWSEHHHPQPGGVAGGGDGDGARGGGVDGHSVQAEHWPLDQAHLEAQGWALFGHQDLQSPDVVEENTSSTLETSAVSEEEDNGPWRRMRGGFAGTESIAERRASIVGLRAHGRSTCLSWAF